MKASKLILCAAAALLSTRLLKGRRARATSRPSLASALSLVLERSQMCDFRKHFRVYPSLPAVSCCISSFAFSFHQSSSESLRTSNGARPQASRFRALTFQSRAEGYWSNPNCEECAGLMTLWARSVCGANNCELCVAFVKHSPRQRTTTASAFFFEALPPERARRVPCFHKIFILHRNAWRIPTLNET